MKVTSLLDEMEKRNIINPAAKKALENQCAAKSNMQNENDAKNDTSGVSLEISDKSMQKYIDLLNFQQNMESVKQQEKAAKDSANELGKILTIFRRILNGDRVPQKDEKKLIDYSPEMYQAAKAVAAMSDNKKPKDYKSVDEEDESNEKAHYKSTGIIDMFEHGAEASPENISTSFLS